MLRRFSEVFRKNAKVDVVLDRLMDVIKTSSGYSPCLVSKCKSALIRMLAILALRWEMKDKTSLLRNHISLGVLQGSKRCRRISGAFKRAVSIQTDLSDGIYTCHGLLQGVDALRDSNNAPTKRQRGVKKDRSKKRSASSQLAGKFARKSTVSERSKRRFTDHEMFNYHLSIRTGSSQKSYCRLCFLLGVRTDITFHACDNFRVRLAFVPILLGTAEF